MQAGDVRARIGEGKILGVSAHSVEEALALNGTGADYLGVGAIYGTATKPDANSRYRSDAAADLPGGEHAIEVGGIAEGNILNLNGSGIDRVAVVSAIFTCAAGYNRGSEATAPVSRSDGATMKLETAIFDLDGTLLDSMPIWQGLEKKYLLQKLQPAPGLHDALKTMSLTQAAQLFGRHSCTKMRRQSSGKSRR